MSKYEGTGMSPLLPLFLQSAGFTALYLAAQENSPAICELLLEKGARCNVQGGSQQLTPLHLAAHAGYMAVCCILAEHGADPHLKDSDGDSPLQLCSAELKAAILGAWSCVFCWGDAEGALRLA